MTRKARLWTGATLLLVLVLNYGMFGIPLVQRKAYIEKRAKMILVVKNADDEYILDIFRKEISAVNKKIYLMNCVGLSFAIIITSWTVFGLIVHKKK
jgi:hypothetical protein